LKYRLGARAAFVAGFGNLRGKRHKKRGAAGRGIEDTVMPRPNAGVHHDADGVVREMRRREICREPFTAHLRHKQRVEVRDPIVPFVIWKVRKKRADGGPGKALLDDSFAYLSGSCASVSVSTR
jgi:hypothetical protein